jgi:hypothetical protein
MTDDEVRKRYDGETFIGRSKRARIMKPSLRRAVSAAYREASATNAGSSDAKAYRVLDIWAIGTNPLSEYIVVLGPDA